MRRWISGAVLAAALAFTPASSLAQTRPANATAECKDGTFSTAKTKRGACSGHGGIKTWLADTSAGAKADTKAAAKDTKSAAKNASKATKDAAKSAAKETKGAAKSAARATSGVANDIKSKPSDAPQDATAKCKDGSYSHAQQHRGACSGHGGVAEWYK